MKAKLSAQRIIEDGSSTYLCTVVSLFLLIGNSSDEFFCEKFNVKYFIDSKTQPVAFTLTAYRIGCISFSLGKLKIRLVLHTPGLNIHLPLLSSMI
ncbi:Protein of unknown function [Cotesia congregata]|uniref:Uncharacterized protein n=1 Tax=Cotesia congregata TaxID=51543 RepID=A0A8J2MR94_COTCN|nr:Protein of unknown function [Cotesia congregata]